MSNANERKVDKAAEAKLNADPYEREARRRMALAQRRAERRSRRRKAEGAAALWRAAAAWTEDGAAYKWAEDSGDKAGVWTLGADAIPAGLRYLSASALPDKHKWLNADGIDGFIVGALARVGEWRRAYPNAPERVEAVHLIAIGADGDKAEFDKGGDKRMQGDAKGKVCAVWAPGAERTAGAAVCEGLADAMAIASGAFAGAGSGGIVFSAFNWMRNADVADELARLSGAVWIYPDHDDGMMRAMDMAWHIRAARGESHIADYDKEANDPADAAQRKARADE